VRTGRELKSRLASLDAMLEFKRHGKVRAVGISSHGLDALKTAAEMPDIDVVWARINFAGLYMDSNSLTLYDQFASISWLKKVVKTLVPKKVISAIRPSPESQVISRMTAKVWKKHLRIYTPCQRGLLE